MNNIVKSLGALALVVAVGIGASTITNGASESASEKLVSTAVVKTEPAKTEVASGQKRITQLGIDKSRAVFVYGEIGDTTETVKAIYELDKKDSKSPIYLIIDSPGGSVFDGALVLSAMEGVKAPVKTVCVGLCASMAAIIHAYGSERLMLDRAVLMYHDYAGGLQGYGAHMTSRLTLINRYTQKMASYIATRASIDPSAFQDTLSRELWIDGEDATVRGFNDKLVALDVNGLYASPEVAERARKLRSYRTRILDIKNWNLSVATEYRYQLEVR